MNLVNDIPIGQDYPLVVNAVVEVEKDYKNLKDLDPHWLATTLQFFTHYKDLEKDKTAIVNGWLNKSEAKKIINAAHKRWKNKLNSGLYDLL